MEERPVLRDIAWSELAPWLLLVGVARLASDPRKLLLAAVALALTVYGWALLAAVFSSDVEPASVLGLPPTASQLVTKENAAAADPYSTMWWGIHPLISPWEQLARPLRSTFAWDLSWPNLGLAASAAVWAGLVWAVFGGALSRIAALQLTREERLSIAGALRFSLARVHSYFGGPLLPLSGVALAVVLVALVPGLVLRAGDAGLIFFGLLLPILLIIVGLSVAVFLVGLLFGWPLMWATISVEGSDAFDAVSRSFSYTFQRPLHYFAYAAVAFVLGYAAWIIAVLFATLVVYATLWSASWGSGAERVSEVLAWSQTGAHAPFLPGLWPPEATEVNELTPAGQTGVLLVRLSLAGVKLLLLGFAYSYFWTASTAVYLLLRQATDATELDEVFLEEPQQPAALPPLVQDDAGVAVLEPTSEQSGEEDAGEPSK